MRSRWKVAVALIDVAISVACANPMQPELARPRDRDCEVWAVESDSVTSLIPVQLRCSARVRVVCG